MTFLNCSIWWPNYLLVKKQNKKTNSQIKFPVSFLAGVRLWELCNNAYRARECLLQGDTTGTINTWLKLNCNYFIIGNYSHYLFCHSSTLQIKQDTRRLQLLQNLSTCLVDSIGLNLCVLTTECI